MEIRTPTLTAVWPALALAACTADARDDGQGTGSFTEGSCGVPEVSACEGCIEFRREVRLGAEGGDPGLLVGVAGMLSVARDTGDRYWVGQADQIAVFESNGTFAATVGRSGQGPLEFARVRAFSVDDRNRVHVVDNGNRRISVIEQDFSLGGETTFPAVIEEIVAFRDGNGETSAGYIFQSWMPSPERIGLPLHLLEGDEVTSSFGVVAEAATAPTPLDLVTARRALAVDPAGTVYSAELAHYVVEAWTEAGSRLGRMEGPPLDDGLRGEPGPWTLDNPPEHSLRDISFDAEGRLWVILVYRRPDWRDRVVERVEPNGAVRLEFPQGVSAVFRSRVEVIDLASCASLASGWFEDGSLGFFVRTAAVPPSPSVTSLGEGAVGDPLVDVWRLQW